MQGEAHISVFFEAIGPTWFQIRFAVAMLLPLWVSGVASLRAQEKMANPAGEPEIVSIFPLGARQGASFQAQVRGRNLDRAYAVWFLSESVKARVERVEEVEDLKLDVLDKTKTKKGHRVLLRVEIGPEARVGSHSLRLVSPRGVSNPLSFNVTPDPVIRETESPHHKPDQAQVIEFPVIVNGRISEGGEVDYYGFDVLQGEELVFEVSGSVKQLELYDPSGSWFEPKRAIRLAINERGKRRLTYRFPNDGRYLIQVKSLLGDGNPDTVYQLRIAPIDQLDASQEGEKVRSASSEDLAERTFSRRLEPNRLQVLWSRTVKVPTSGSETGQSDVAGATGDKRAPTGHEAVHLSTGVTAKIVREKEPNERPEQALEVSIPTIIEGAIERPGDRDSFRFKVQSGEKLAFEIETPDETPLLFNPRLGVSDEDGNEFLTNVYKRIVRNFTFYQKDIQPKTVYTFKLGGEYTLQIRDLTSRYGDPSFVYRLLIRPQIPHAGEVQVMQDHINLKIGSAKKLTLVTEQEEGFAGEIALSVENLPPGVEAVPGTDVEPDKGPPVDEGYKERFVPKTQKATILLFAHADVPLTPMPRMIRVSARPVVGEQPGKRLPVREILLMVVGKDAGENSSAP